MKTRKTLVVVCFIIGLVFLGCSSESWLVGSWTSNSGMKLVVTEKTFHIEMAEAVTYNYEIVEDSGDVLILGLTKLIGKGVDENVRIVRKNKDIIIFVKTEWHRSK